MEQIKEWESKNPDWMDDEKKSEEYFKMMREVAWDVNEGEREKNIKDIIKNVGDNILIKDAISEV